MSDLLKRPAFPRSNTYDPQWVLENNMGPHALWLVEWLTERIELEPGMYCVAGPVAVIAGSRCTFRGNGRVVA